MGHVGALRVGFRVWGNGLGLGRVGFGFGCDGFWGVGFGFGKGQLGFPAWCVVF